MSEPERFDSSLAGETCMALRMLPSAAEITLGEPPGPGGAAPQDSPLFEGSSACLTSGLSFEKLASRPAAVRLNGT